MFNQTGFTNWYAGGDNVFSTSLAFYFSHKYVKNKFNLQTTFDARYGINRINKENFKNEDAFVFNLSSSWEINKNWSYAATFQYRSQFSKRVQITYRQYPRIELYGAWYHRTGYRFYLSKQKGPFDHQYYARLR